ncbi:MAG: ArgE/DapE family deacylase [Planctomycetes bacterium]|nr:ArgE/DapE family deacylase [Planctomycetota bacterium]
MNGNLTGSLAKSIKSYMQNEEQRIVDDTRALINARTENPPGNEITAARVVEAFFTSLDIPYTLFEKTKDRTNIVGRIGSGSPSLLVACHLDVVPAGDEWKRNPFDAWVENGRIFGRGASDNKGQMAAMMAVARFLKENESRLKGQLILVGAADEERGSNLGLEYLVKECGIRADYAIIPDVAHNMKMIDVTEKGALFLEIISHGKQAHGSRPEMGINAVWHLITLLERIKQIKFRHTSHPLHTQPTLNLGSIHGGTAPNIVPALCKAQLDIRYLPDDSGDEILANLTSIAKEVESQSKAHFEIKIVSHQLPTAVPINNPLVEIISKHTESVLGARPKPKGMSGATVTKQLIQSGITAVGFGPGDEAEAHATNESISIRELVDFAEIMALITLDMLV